MKEEERGEEVVVVEVEGAAFLKMTGMKMKLQPQIYRYRCRFWWHLK